MKAVQDILQYTQEDYDRLFFELYFAWCDHYTSEDSEVQSLLCYQPLLNWFRSEYTKLEHKFLTDTEAYADVIDIEELRTYYDKTVSEIGKCYSKVLMKNAIKMPFKLSKNTIKNDNHSYHFN